MIRVRKYKPKQVNVIKLKNYLEKFYNKKKKQLLVSNLSEAINEVDTKEKNNPKLNNNTINIRSVLSIFFHHL